jgi:hypothetical protein
MPQDQDSSQDLFLYNTEIFDFILVDAVQYDPKFPKTIFTLTLQEKASRKQFRFIQSHIPGGPDNSPAACAKFAKEAMRQYDPSLTIVLMGDMNQPSKVIEEALNVAAEELEIAQPYRSLNVAYPTHINTMQQASWIDNLFAYTPDSWDAIHVSEDPEELSESLEPTVQLLKDKKETKNFSIAR